MYIYIHSFSNPTSQGKVRAPEKKKKKNTASPSAQSCSSLLRLETYCGRCKNIFLPPSHTLWVLQCVPKNYGGTHFFRGGGGFDVEAYCSFPPLALVYSSFWSSISAGMHFFPPLYLSLLFSGNAASFLHSQTGQHVGFFQHDGLPALWQRCYCH